MVNTGIITVLGIYSSNTITTDSEVIRALPWRPDLKILEGVLAYFQLEAKMFIGYNKPTWVIKNYIILNEDVNKASIGC